MPKIWLTSDTHFAHRNSMRYCGRPFLTVERCDNAMIKNWNAIVKPEDTIYHLGDVAMHTVPMKRILPQLNGKKILIVGNHDFIYDYFTKTRGQKFTDKMVVEYKAAGFSEIYLSGYEISVKDPLVGLDIPIRLSHFPTKNAYDPHHQDKHDNSKPIDDGKLNICGHVHQNWLKRGNNVNAGVDVWDFKPISIDSIISLWITHLRTDLDNPRPIRTMVWKLYHTVIWKLKSIFQKKNQSNQNRSSPNKGIKNG